MNLNASIWKHSPRYSSWPRVTKHSPRYSSWPRATKRWQYHEIAHCPSKILVSVFLWKHLALCLWGQRRWQYTNPVCHSFSLFFVIHKTPFILQVARPANGQRVERWMNDRASSFPGILRMDEGRGKVNKDFCDLAAAAFLLQSSWPRLYADVWIWVHAK